MNNKTEHTAASLKIVPYYVIKKPSDPSLIGSLTSCIALVPGSLSRIQHKIHKLNTIKENDITNAENAIRFVNEFDTNIAKIKIVTKGTANNPYLTGCMPLVFS